MLQSQPGRYIASKLVDVLVALILTAIFSLAFGYFVKPLESLSVSNLLFVVLVSGLVSLIIVRWLNRGIERYILGEGRRQSKTPTFKFVITEKKDAYHRGEHIYFYSKYDGLLSDGYFMNVIHAPTGTHFRKGGTILKIRSPQSNRVRLSTFPLPQGALNHDEPHQERWSWRIPKDAPLGTYSVEMIVGNEPLFGQWGFKRIAQSDDTFVVS